MKRIFLALVFSALAWPAMAATCAVSTLQVKDNASTTANMTVGDDGSGSGNCESNVQVKGHGGATLDGTAGSPSTGVLTVQGVSGGQAVPASQSGTWNVNNVSGTVSLPTGAATSANQSTNGATTSHTCSTGGFSELGCLGQIDDDVKATGTVNPGTAANWGIGATGSAVPANAPYIGGDAQSSEPSKATTGNLTGAFYDLTGKQITSPYANRENMVRGSQSETGTSAGTLLAAAGASIKNYVTDVECGRTDAGTTAIYVTFSDTASTILVLPNNGGGGGNNKTFNVPLVTAANTAFTFTASSGVSTVYCSAQGFTGY